jgi:hypothetical protein
MIRFAFMQSRSSVLVGAIGLGVSWRSCSPVRVRTSRTSMTPSRALAAWPVGGLPPGLSQGNM